MEAVVVLGRVQEPRFMGSYFIFRVLPLSPDPQVATRGKPSGHEQQAAAPKTGLHSFNVRIDAPGTRLIHQPQHRLEPALVPFASLLLLVRLFCLHFSDPVSCEPGCGCNVKANIR